MKMWTVRNADTGAVQMTGFHCETAEEAVAEYIALYPSWSEDELYASEANWND